MAYSAFSSASSGPFGVVCSSSPLVFLHWLFMGLSTKSCKVRSPRCTLGRLEANMGAFDPWIFELVFSFRDLGVSVCTAGMLRQAELIELGTGVAGSEV